MVFELEPDFLKHFSSCSITAFKYSTLENLRFAFFTSTCKHRIQFQYYKKTLITWNKTFAMAETVTFFAVDPWEYEPSKLACKSIFEASTIYSLHQTFSSFSDRFHDFETNFESCNFQETHVFGETKIRNKRHKANNTT